ncbi:MAG TPA: NADH-quinone oxidoreductase subunit M [Trueperaceae bacterium]|nr:NADH-quinone oxidoreductase subunit M [Trueperaceae bacterium]
MTALLMILVPLLAAVLVTLTRSSLGVARVLALAGSVAVLVLAILLPGTRPFDAPWLPGIGVSFSLDGNGAGAVLAFAAALMMIPAILVATTRVAKGAATFAALLLVAQAGLNGIFLAKDLVLFYVFWEATLIPSLLLLGIYGGEKRREATVKYLVYAVTGSFFMLVSMLALKTLSGAASFHIIDLMLVTPNLPVATQTWLFIGLAIGMAVKLPIWPLHSWLVDLNEQNHPSGAADVLGSLYKVGAFGFFAWALPLLPAGAVRVAPVLLALSAVTAIYGALGAVGTNHLKRFLAYGSLSHMGIIGVGVFGMHLAGMSGAMYFLAAQMVSTGGLFLVMGMLYHRRRSLDMADYGGVAKSAPALAAFALFLIFTFIGVPGLSNFPGEFMSLLGAFQTAPWPATIATLAVIAAGVYGVNLSQRLFQGKENVRVAELDSLEMYVLLPVVVGVLWFGLAPAPHLGRIEAQSQITALQLERVATPLGERTLSEGGGGK